MPALLPLVVPWLVTPLYLLLDGRRHWVAWSSVVVLGFVTCCDVVLLVQLGTAHVSALELTTGHWPQGVGIRLRVDGLACYFGAISAIVLSLAMLHEARRKGSSRLLPALFLALCSGLHGAFFAGDLFNFYVFFELSVITSFALAAYGYGRAEIRGTFMYVILNLFGSALFLLGVAALYYVAGTLDLVELERQARLPHSEHGRHYFPSAALLFVALTIKLGLFPFHAWVPVLYSHARPAVSAALAGALVNIAAFGLVHFGLSVFEQVRQAASDLLVVLGLTATLYGAVLAATRSRPDEAVAYAAIAHAGLLVFALGVGGTHGLAALLLGVAAGSFDKAALFLWLDCAPGARSRGSFVAASSTAGMPLTLGFVFKIELVRAAVQARLGWPLVAVLLLGLVVLIIASFRLWRLAREGASSSRAQGSRWAPFALASATVLLGVVPGPLHSTTLGLATELQRGRG